VFGDVRLFDGAACTLMCDVCLFVCECVCVCVCVCVGWTRSTFTGVPGWCSFYSMFSTNCLSEICQRAVIYKKHCQDVALHRVGLGSLPDSAPASVGEGTCTCKCSGTAMRGVFV
jgi:hypothetical protein